MRQYDLALEKYWVTHSGYFRLAVIVALGMGMTYENLPFCYLFQKKGGKRKFQ